MPSVIRTPDKHFENLEEWPYEPKYVEIGDTRMHYVDEGQGETILCLHGEPSWAYLYRKFIPSLSRKFRVVVPDLIGFGRSDKYTETADYTFEMHFSKLEQFVRALDLSDITVVVQDWGGLLGLSLVGKYPELFKRLVIMNTYLPTGERAMPPAFKIWRAFSQYMPGLPIGFIMDIGTARKLSPGAKKAYTAPFPSMKYKAGARKFPALVPSSSDDPAVPYMLKAREVLKGWTKPVIIMFSDKDPIMSSAWKWFHHNIPSAKEQGRITIKNAGHFLQEDAGEVIASHIAAFMNRTA